MPIRPAVNNKNAPTHKIVNKLNHIFKSQIQLSKKYVVEYLIMLDHNLKILEISDNHKRLTLDIKHLYVKIPIDEILDITKTHLTIHNDPQTTNQITNILSTILEENYLLSRSRSSNRTRDSLGIANFRHHELNLSATPKNTHVKLLLDTNHNLFDARYVDDILIIYYSTRNSCDMITH
jgi:hypothetical protein